MTPRWPHGDPLDVARSVLSDGRFHVAIRPPRAKSLWNLVTDAIGAVWDRFWEQVGRLGADAAITNVIGLVVLGAAVAFLVLVLVRFSRVYRARTSSRRSAHPVAAPDAGADARSLRARALAAVAQGRYREAAALLWLSALRALDERGRVPYDAARTPGEWRSLVRDPAFDAFARDAVVALFAARAVDRELVDRMDAAYDRVVPA